MAGILAGCGGSGLDDSYGRWIPTTDDGLLTAYIDLTLTEKTSNINPILPLVVPPAEDGTPEEYVPDLTVLDQINDPLLRFPLQTGGRIISVSSLSLAFAGLGDLIDLGNPTRGVTELFVADETVVGTGDIDVDSADEALRSGTNSPFGENEFEPVGERGDYAYYEPVGNLPGTAAVSESAVLVADSLAAVDRVIDTREGDHGRAVEDNEVFDWLFDVAGTGDVAVGWVGPIPLEGHYWGNQDPMTPADIASKRDNVASSVTFSPERGELTAEFALRNEDLSRERMDGLEKKLGASSNETSVSEKPDRLSMTGTYANEALDIDFVEHRDMTPTQSVPTGEDIPDAVASTVPSNAFEFVYKESVNRVKVNFREEFEADKVTVRAKQTGSETSLSTSGSVTFLAVTVDPDGDEVLVIVTVDGKSGVVARKEIP